jgi:hypothetical protein
MANRFTMARWVRSNLQKLDALKQDEQSKTGERKMVEIRFVKAKYLKAERSGRKRTRH